MDIINFIFYLINDAVWIAILATITLMILRMIVIYGDVNPFGRIASTVRQLSDRLVLPVRGSLIALGADPKFAPFVTILVIILFGWCALQLTESIHLTVAGVLDSIRTGSLKRLIGYILHGLLSIYGILIFMRIIFSWGMMSYRNRLMRFLVDVTEPLLGPLRRLIPMVGPFDISPIVAFFVIWLFQKAIEGTLLNGL